MVKRGEVFWADLGEPHGSGPGKRRPVVVVQADAYNASRLATTIVATLTTNTALAAMPGNVFLPAASTGLSKDSVVNVTALLSVDRRRLDTHSVGMVPSYLLSEIDAGLRRVLGL